MGTCRLKAEPIKRHNVSKRHLLRPNKHYLKDTGLQIATKRAFIWNCCKAIVTTVSHDTTGIWITENVFISFGLKSLCRKNMEALSEILKLCNFTGMKHQQELHQRSHLPSVVSNTIKPSHQTAVSKVTNTTFLSIHRPLGNWAGHGFLQRYVQPEGLPITLQRQHARAGNCQARRLEVSQNATFTQCGKCIPASSRRFP